jgi:hypothetical protein
MFRIDLLYVHRCYYIGRTYCIFWNTFTILNFLHNKEFYLQHVLQLNDNAHNTNTTDEK